MIKRKCRECAEKIERKFNYCPWCGASVKESGMGMLGASDMGRIEEDLKLPFGVDKIMNSLVKQLEKQLGNMDFDDKDGMPKNFKIQIARGGPGVMGPMIQEQRKKMPVARISEEEGKRRSGLKKVEASSRVKRLGDVIVYEIETPGVRGKEDVVLSELETGIEVRVFARDKCYVKVIPLKVEVLGIRASGDKVFVEMRG